MRLRTVRDMNGASLREGCLIVVPEGQEEAVAKLIAGNIEKTDDWGCPSCGSKNVTVEAIKGQAYNVPITSLWSSETHGSRAYLDWKEVPERGISTTVFDRLRCQDCRWSERTRGDTAVLRRTT